LLTLCEQLIIKPAGEQIMLHKNPGPTPIANKNSRLMFNFNLTHIAKNNLSILLILKGKFVKNIILILLTIFFLPVLALGGYIDNGDGTITDESTGLIWQQDGTTAKNWTDATSYCTALSLQGQNNWRLPELDELLTLIDPNRTESPFINIDHFPNTFASLYWSATENEDGAYAVNFTDGGYELKDKSSSLYVRAVRQQAESSTTTTVSSGGSGEYKLEYVSGNNQTYRGGGMPRPMVFRIKNTVTNTYVTTSHLGELGLSLTATASTGYQDAEFNNLNNYDSLGAEAYGGYYYVEVNSGPAYTLKITVNLSLNGDIIDTYLINENILSTGTSTTTTTVSTKTTTTSTTVPESPDKVSAEIRADDNGLHVNYDFWIIGKNQSTLTPGSQPLVISVLGLATIELSVLDVLPETKKIIVHATASAPSFGIPPVETDLSVSFGAYGIYHNLVDRQFIPIGDNRIEISALLTRLKTQYDVNFSLEPSFSGHWLGTKNPLDNTIHETVQDPADDSTYDITIALEYTSYFFTNTTLTIAGGSASSDPIGPFPVPNGTYHIWASFETPE